MRVPIPDDWNGIDWHCIQIEWPESPQWTGLLIGVLTLLTRGRYWDERTGTITDVQAIAREIFDRAYPFVSCDGDIITPPVLPDLPSGYGGGNSLDDEESENDMPAVTWLEIDENGTLYMYFGPCCKIEVGGDFAIAVDPPPTDTNDETPPSETWACNKAAGIAENLAMAMVDVLAVMSPLGALNEQTNACKNALAAFGAVWSDCREVALAYRADSVNIDTMVADAETEEWLACLWAPQLANTDNISASEFFSIRSAPFTHFSTTEAAFISQLALAIGQPAFAWWARMTHDIAAADCDCPTVEPPYLGSISWDTGWTWGAHTGIAMVTPPTISGGGKYIRFEMINDGGIYREAQQINLPLTGAVAGDSITIRQRPYQLTDLGTDQWQTFQPVIDPALWAIMYPQYTGSAPSNAYSSGAGYRQVIMTAAGDTIVNANRVTSRWAPDNPGTINTYYWEMEIYAINGVPV